MAATGKHQDDDDDDDDDDVLHDPPGFASLADNAQRKARRGWSVSVHAPKTKTTMMIIINIIQRQRSV